MVKKRIIKQDEEDVAHREWLKKNYEGKVRDECGINYDFTREPTSEEIKEAEEHAEEFNDMVKRLEDEHKAEEATKSVTIMKYQGKDGGHYFIVKDKFDITDEVERLDAMNRLRDEMLASGEMVRHLWTKETVLF